MKRFDKIALLLKKAKPSEALAQSDDLKAYGSQEPAPAAVPSTTPKPLTDEQYRMKIEWEAYKQQNPLESDKLHGVPKDLRGLFTEEELGLSGGEYMRSKHVGPEELKGLFSDEELGLIPKPYDWNAKSPEEKSPEEKPLKKVETLKRGARDSSTNGLVSEVQALLDKYKYLQSASGIDGVFGKETERAVLDFQKNNKNLGLIESGNVDEATLEALQGSSVKERPSGAHSAVLTEEEIRRQRARGRNAPKVSGSGRVSAAQLYADLKAGVANPNLCKAMVANAIAESALYYNINGDCGSYAKSKGKRSLDTSLYPGSFRKPKRGKCCSFGLWQYNICGGLGNYLLKAYGASGDSSDEEKIAILTSYEKQVQFMIRHVNKKAKISSRADKSVDWWVEWFVRKVERPAKADRAVVKRQQIARGLNFA